MNTKESCTCNECIKACRNRPGWFKPGEAEKVAGYLKISLQELFNKYLQVDYWVGDGKKHPSDILNLSPGIVEEMHCKVVTWFPRGTCVFLKEDRCSIHPVKPFECKMTVCCNDNEHEDDCHEEAGLSWNNEKDQLQVNKLLEGWGNR